jgi:hypothetical protein
MRCRATQIMMPQVLRTTTFMNFEIEPASVHTQCGEVWLEPPVFSFAEFTFT